MEIRLYMEMERKIRLFKNRIRRGAKWLDKHDEPDWRDKINKMTLDLSDGNLCMLGQRFGTYGRGINVWRRFRGFNLGEQPHRWWRSWAVAYGFCTESYICAENHGDYILLTKLWIEYIENCKKLVSYQEKKQSNSSKPSLAMALIPNGERQMVDENDALSWLLDKEEESENQRHRVKHYERMS